MKKILVKCYNLKCKYNKATICTSSTICITANGKCVYYSEK